MLLKQQIDDKKLNPNTARNRLKPIKTLLRANEIDFSWYLIDRMMPKETKSTDRAYTREEIQKMIIHCEDITDKVIITAFSCAGLRLEAWIISHGMMLCFLKMKMELTRAEHYESITAM